MGDPAIYRLQPNVVVTPDPTGQYNRYDTYLAIDPNDSTHMVGICRRFYGPGLDYQDVLEFQSSVDGGQTWTSLALPLGDYYSISDPWIGIAPNRNIYVIALQVSSAYSGGTTTGRQSAAGQLRGSNVCCYTSTDNGQSWSFAVIPGSDGWNPDNTFGAIDPTSSTVYAIWNSSDVIGAGLNGTLAFAYSADGNTWNASKAALPRGNSIYDLTQRGFNFVNISVAPDDGSIHIIGFDLNNNVSYARSQHQGRSLDFGGIAGPQIGTGDIWQATSPTFLGPVNPPAILAAGNGLVLAAWSVDTGHTADIPGPQMRICVSSCNDGSTGWAGTTVAKAPTTAPFLPLGSFSQTPQDQYFLPRLSGMPNGVVGCAFQYCQVGGPVP